MLLGISEIAFSCEGGQIERCIRRKHLAWRKFDWIFVIAGEIWMVGAAIRVIPRMEEDVVEGTGGEGEITLVVRSEPTIEFRSFPDTRGDLTGGFRGDFLFAVESREEAEENAAEYAGIAIIQLWEGRRD